MISKLMGIGVAATMLGGVTPAGSAGHRHPRATARGGALGELPAFVLPAGPVVPGSVARIVRGTAYAPAEAPLQVQRAIWAGNRIRTKPYLYAGGHGHFDDAGYDCSGSVSYILHAAGLTNTPMDSSDLMSWGRPGHGRWITVYSDPAHAFVQIAGIRLDTSADADPNPAPGSGPRWRPEYLRADGFMARRPEGTL